jgi:hypothetical protein
VAATGRMVLMDDVAEVIGAEGEIMLDKLILKRVY